MCTFGVLGLSGKSPGEGWGPEGCCPEGSGPEPRKSGEEGVEGAGFWAARVSHDSPRAQVHI